ncbi:zinc finger protein DZIP1L isoform X1 [Gallus gallus]|uniref:DAZ interacting zinc finger protein 1 like n=1 Tax=Gallus gallus TaxID=9031 RepID=A0A8V0ZT55_CHICK|nr:zinc finger protein DZIP1L isoform X1 [Gallus gallus]XP_422684.4 zinc finger protein DZIP1L isoform X1 [Gallus gallus]
MAMLAAPPAPTIPPNTFCFQPRRIAVDRHRLSAVDVERVAREGDVAVLQEHISNITFCNMREERCPYCGQPADPVLLTVLRLAQLSIEYLLHCQQRLADSLAVHAQNLQDARAQLAHAQGLASEQAARLRHEKEESRRWKKLVATQLLLQARPSGYCKGAAGASRSHPRSQWLCSPGFAETKKVERMEEEVEELKAKLREMQQQLAAGREAEKLCREQEEKRAHQREMEGRRDFEKWKEEERMKLHVEMDGLRQRFLTELQDAASRSSAMEGKLQELQARTGVVSSLGTLQDDDSELERTAVRTKLLSANKPKVTQQVTRAVVSEESSEGDTADDAQSGKRRLLEALWRKPNLLKKFRHILEEALEEKLESMGVSRVAKGISTQTYQHLQAVLRLQQQQKAKNSPGLFHLRDELIQVVMRRVRQLKKPRIPLPRQLSIIPGTAVSMKGRPLERRLDANTQRPASGMKSHP